jgi:NaMN:DMB phosphoribosyltransferase
VDSGTLFANAASNRVGIGSSTPQNTLNVVVDQILLACLRFGSLPANSLTILTLQQIQ